jgi:predicted GNAT family N-acyltransferase
VAIVSREPKGEAELEQAMALRRRVFCEEQGVDPSAEFDGLDEHCRQIVALEDGVVIGTCRLRGLEPGAVKLERMAVERSWRVSGAGRSLCDAADRLAGEMGASRIVLHAQRQAEGFYASCGYAPRGETFIEEGIPHVLMEREV